MTTCEENMVIHQPQRNIYLSLVKIMVLEHGAVNKDILIERFNMSVAQLLFYTFSLGITCYTFGLWKGQEIERKLHKTGTHRSRKNS